MKHHLLFVALCLAFANSGFAQSDINTKNIRKHITYLADDARRGRAPGSKGEEQSAVYIERQFKKYGLLPKGTANYRQPFVYVQNDNPHGSEAAHGEACKGANVIGFLDNGAAQTIIIGAHYDHLGDDGRGSSLDANPAGKIHNGADDNASGVAGLLELARHYSQNKDKEAYNFLFIAFSAEEAGLIGSKYYTNNPTLPLNTTQAMLNMDMIGRLNDSTMKLMVYGVGTSPIFVPLLRNLTDNPFHIVTDSSGVGPSDHTSFYLKDLPVLHFFTGQHKDYHKPSDDIEKINFEGERKVLTLMTQIIDKLALSPKLSFHATRTPTQNTNGGFKVSLGIMPDYAFDGEGVHVDGVTDGRAAQKAGILRDDIILQLGNYEVKNIYSYMDALNHFEKGKTTTIRVKRKNEMKELTVTF
jgi:Zn-dependent M28 family amino/carboxypeptidase